jgi:hypothetical protein
MRRVAAIQSSYVPWKGYFDVVGLVDTFVLYDDVQFTKNDWRNRNRIKTRQGTAWLTIPVQTTGRFGQLIQEVEIGDPRWAEKHWKSLQANYARAQAWESVAPAVQALYAEAADERLLSRVNEIFIRGLCGLIGLETCIRRAAEFDLPDDRNDRLIALCRQVGASEYLSGPAAKGYLDCGLFARQGISVRWMSYDGYPEYRQLFRPPFVHEVSILDLLFAEGAPGARDFLLSSRRRTAV